MYECPNCGGNLKFDISRQTLACTFCDTQADPYSFDDRQKAKVSEENGNTCGNGSARRAESGEWELPEADEYEVTRFTCPQCGGEILSTDTSAAEFCSFCGASTILHQRITKEKRPKYIIPFQKTKEDCKKAYEGRLKKAFFAPKDMKNPKYIDGFRGIYMPYWSYYVTQQEEFSFPGSRTHRSGDYIITDHFRLSGTVDGYYDGLSYDASTSFDDAISEQLAPYDLSAKKEFTPAFLSGFYADVADVDPKTGADRAYDFAVENTAQEVYRTPDFVPFSVGGGLEGNDLGTKVSRCDGAMFPVWFLSYRNHDRVAYATVNGQTGKVVCDLPIDEKKYFWSSLVLAVPIFLLFNLGLTLTPTALLVCVALISGVIEGIGFVHRMAIAKKEETGRMAPSMIVGLFVLLLAIGILFWQPANDLFFYGAALLLLGTDLWMFLEVIRSYNQMSTRRLPQFDRTGGDDNA